MVEQPLTELSNAIKAKAGARFASAFANLTTACNRMCLSRDLQEVVVSIPTGPPIKMPF